MVGSVGMARSVSRPNSLVIQESLNLLSALGGNKAGATTKLLIEMKSIQDHNEIVIVNAREAVVKANQREDAVFKREEDLARDLVRAEELYKLQLLETSNAEKELQRKVDNTAIQISEENGRIGLREDQLRDDRGKHEENMRADRTELTDRESVLTEGKENLEVRESAMEDRGAEIERDRVTLGNRAVSLDKFKSELDDRDARMRTAMGN